jgi:hypothetical protein
MHLKHIMILHPANYKYQPLRQKQYTSPAPLQKPLHAQPGVTYAQITKQNICNPAPPRPCPSHQSVPTAP